MGCPSGATRPSSSVTGSSYSYRLPLSAPATNAERTGSVASLNATVPVSMVPTRDTFASNSPSLTAPAGRSVASTRSSTVPGVRVPHDSDPSTTLGVTWLARTVPAATRSTKSARMGERDRDMPASWAGWLSFEDRRARRRPRTTSSSNSLHGGGARGTDLRHPRHASRAALAFAPTRRGDEMSATDNAATLSAYAVGHDASHLTEDAVFTDMNS